jgi:hypothetical protein
MTESKIPPYPPHLKPRGRGRQLWRELHTSADFSDIPETRLVAEEACYLADEIERLRSVVRSAGEDTRVSGYNGQPTSMPEVDDLRKSQSLLLSMLKSLRLPDENGGDSKLTRSQVGRLAADARWHG